MHHARFVPGDGRNVLEHRHSHLHEAARMAKRDLTTINGQVVSVVYVTASPTFTGVIGGYTTSDDSAASTTASSSTSRTFPAAATGTAPSDDSSTATTESISSVARSTSTSSSAELQSTLTTSSSSSAASSSLKSGTTTLASSASSTSATTAVSSDDSTSSSSNTGFSTAGKAGLAIGIILLIGAVLGLILFLLSKKKRQRKAEQARQDAEKQAAVAAAATAALAAARQAQTPVNAPRLSLRPASSFLPEFMGGAKPKSRLSQNMPAATSNESNFMNEKYITTPPAGQQAIPMSEKSVLTENPFEDPENPFVDPEQSAPQPPAPAPVGMPEPQVASLPVLLPEPIPAPAPVTMSSSVSDGSSDKIVVAAASAGAAAVAQAAMRSNHATQQIPVGPGSASPEPVEMPSPPVVMPAPLDTSKSVVPNAAPGTSEGQVYRILIDFSPSMEDELELRSGQVVRLVHEYDDGWCLCARLDRSQQGVVPRTCLAAKPSKPRPGPGQRPMSPAMGPPGPNGRPMNPAVRQGPLSQGRPMSPGMSGSMSPGPESQRRAMTPGLKKMGLPVNVERSTSPGGYNQSPRPLSPSPRSQPKRSMSPGSYDNAGGPPPPMAQSRRRSSSSSQTAREVRDRRQSPPGPSPLGAAVPGTAI